MRFNKFHRIVRLALVLAACFLLAACLVVDGREKNSGRDAHSKGYALFDLKLEPNRHVLAKASSADTTFDLDSLIIVLSAPDADTLTYRYSISGRADTGLISVAPQAYVLPALRNWKARIYSIDEQQDPFRRDTVHHDSVVFGVKPADTALVIKMVSPAFAILRARFLSSEADSIPEKVLYVRLRVDGVTRDSVILGGRNATLRWLQTLPGSTIFAAGDSGRILKSTNDAQTTDTGAWTETVVTTQRLVGGHFPNATNGYVVSIGGQVFKTENAGASWTQRATTADSLNAAWFLTSSYGWAVGQNGGIYKTTNDANSWYGTMVSNTTHHLRGVHFPTSEIGFVVGENETILRTTNGSSGGDAAPEFGGVVWTPVAGGWFNQTSQEPSRNFQDILFSSETTGWAVGSGGLTRVTTNGGATWEIRNIDGVGGRNLNALASAGAWNRLFAVADNGEILKSDGEYNWQLSLGSGASGTGTTEDLHDIVVVNQDDTAFAVGDNGTILRATNASTYSWPYVSWVAQSLPGPVDGPQLPPWDSVNSATTSDLNAVHFATPAVGWAVGAGGVIRKTIDSGNTWSSLTSAASTLRAIHAFDASNVYITGANGLLRRTWDGGSNWSNTTTDLPSVTLNSIGFVSSSVGWIVGASNTIYSTSNGGYNWTSRASGTGTYNAVSVGNSRIWIVGNGGQIRRSTNRNHNTSFSSVTAGGGIGTTNLNGAWFSPTSGVGWVVGNGGLIVKLEGNINHNNTNQIDWTPQTSGTTENLLQVHFLNADTGSVVGASGKILKTVDGGATWTSQTSGTTKSLAGIYLQNGLRAIAVGATGTIRRTTSGGLPPGSAPNTQNLRAVHAVNSGTVYVAGDSGTIGKTTNAGGAWSLLTSSTTQNLRALGFLDANTGWAVGDNGTILKTVNGGADWSSQTSGTAEQLRSVDVRTGDTVYATGTNGLILKTVDGGSVWYEQESPISEDVNQVYFFNSAKGWAVGNSGKIVNAVNFGDNWTGGGIKRSLKGVYFTSVSTGWIVGDDGVILKTTDTGSTWIEQNREEGLQLYGIHFINANTGWVTGEGGAIRKTTDGGATWTPQTSGTDIDLQWVNFRDANRGFVIGGTESILETTDGGSNWGGLFVGVPGEREFDRLLTYKYIKPGQSQQVILEAMDRFSLPLRGYQSVIDLVIGAGQDSTLLSPMTRCGHVDSIPCVP